MGPFVELCYEVFGGTSPRQRLIGGALRVSTPPRTAAVAREVASLLVPWWGFAAYGAIYAMTVMAIAALLVVGLIAAAFHRLGLFVTYDELWFFWIAFPLTAPLSAWPLRRWIHRRRADVLLAATTGTLAVGAISRASVITVNGAAHSTHLEVRVEGAGTFRGYVAKAPAWAGSGGVVELIVGPSSVAILLVPDGGVRPFARVV